MKFTIMAYNHLVCRPSPSISCTICKIKKSTLVFYSDREEDKLSRVGRLQFIDNLADGLFLLKEGALALVVIIGEEYVNEICVL